MLSAHRTPTANTNLRQIAAPAESRWDTHRFAPVCGVFLALDTIALKAGYGVCAAFEVGQEAEPAVRPEDDGEVLLYAHAKGTLSFSRIAAKLRTREWMETEACRKAYSDRSWRSGVPNGWIRRVLGFRQFNVRGLEAVRKEWSLECMAPNTHRRTSYHHSCNHIDVFPRVHSMTETQYSHARFWKCALQVNAHSYSQNYRGQDHGLDAAAYAETLLQFCNQEEISVIGMADHGSVQELDLIRDRLSNNGILVFPGFEISSTEKIHMVCLFSEGTSTEELQRFLGKLDRTDPSEPVAPSSLGCVEIAKIIQDLNGFWYAAHMTGSNGLLRLNQDGGGLVHVWTDHRLVQVGQIPGTVDDLEDRYKQIVLNKDPNYRRQRPITAINAKDVAKPEDLTNPRSSTYIKMTRPCFESLLLAFKYPESRVRLHNEVQEHFASRIDRVNIEGGYLDGLTAEFSGHLDAVIGGRGTGKSTLLECIRYALELPHKAEDARKQGDQIVRENLGRAGGRVIIELRSSVNNMKSYKVIRRYGEPARVIDQENNESTLRPVDLLPRAEVYGQNEIYELAKSPDEQTRVLDRFLPADIAEQTELRSAWDKLKKNGEDLERALDQKDEVDAGIAQLPKLQEQVKQYREQGLDEKLRVVPLFEQERQLKPRIEDEIDRVRKAKRVFDENVPDLEFLSDQRLQDLPHAELLRKARQVLERLLTSLHGQGQGVDRALNEADEGLQPILRGLQQALTRSEQQLESEFATLPTMAGKSGREVGMAFKNLLQEIERIKPKRDQLKKIERFVNERERERRNLLGQISDLRSARADARRKAVKDLNKRLEGKLRIDVVPDGVREPLRSFLQGLKGVGREKTKWVDEAEGLTILGLVAAIRKGKDFLLEKEWGLTPLVAETLAKLDTSQLHAIESIDLEERVSIELNVAHSGPPRFQAMERLSTGQQCTAILQLLLLENTDPLIMDQPEDNLDNAFIADRIVKDLLSAKTDRQFLLATHNANIPVFGDAEWIGVFTATQDGADMPSERQGSIDIPEIRDHAAAILEGGREAFVQRRELYGLDDL